VLRVLSHPAGALPPLAPRDATWRGHLTPAVIGAPGTTTALDRLQRDGALVVTTGQQPGLFTGPMYTVHKALAAAALARVLERRWNRPVVPLFWIAGDDHDFAEASTATWIDADGRPLTWSLPARAASAPQLPMSQQLLPPETEQGLALLEASFPAGASCDDTMAWLRRHYRPGTTIHAAFARAVAEMLAPFGILCIDPTHPAFKQAQAPLLGRALDLASSLDQALAALPDAGTGIAAGDGATLVFLETSAGRDRLVLDAQGFRARRSGEVFSRQQLGTLLEREPARFSANVLLRPVVESALLPTVAYVAGPGEMRYLERQAAALYPLLGIERQMPVPRWSGTAVPRFAERLLSRLHLEAEAVIADDGTLARALLERSFPGDARQAIDALRKQVSRSAPVIAAAGKRIDPVLDRAMKGRATRIAAIADDIEAVFNRHLRKRDDIAHSQFQRLRAILLPHGHGQERVFTSPALLGRYGGDWLAAVVQATATWAETLPQGGA
jgi:bacillithiol biosynthesis cysteine-adding enzyme BshC